MKVEQSKYEIFDDFRIILRFLMIYLNLLTKSANIHFASMNEMYLECILIFSLNNILIIVPR